MAVNYQNLGVSIGKGIDAHKMSNYLNVNTVTANTVRQGMDAHLASMAWGDMARNKSIKNPNDFIMGDTLFGSHSRTVGR